MALIISNIFGLIALAFLCISYQTKEKQKFLFVQILANTSYFIQYVFAHAVSASAISLIAVVKVFIFYLEEKLSKKHTKITKVKQTASKNKNIKSKNMYKKINQRELNEFLIIEIVTIIAGIITYDKPLSLIPTIISVIYTFAIWQKNLKITYTIGSIVPIGWIYYNYMVKAYTGAIGSVVEMSAGIIGLVRYCRSTKKEKLINNK